MTERERVYGIGIVVMAAALCAFIRQNERLNDAEVRVQALESVKAAEANRDNDLVRCPTCDGAGEIRAKYEGASGGIFLTIHPADAPPLKCWTCRGRCWVTRAEIRLQAITPAGPVVWEAGRH